MRQNNKVLLVILILIVILACIVTLTHITNTQENTINTTVAGNNTNGTVYKTICGNASSNDTVVLILGVHSFESGIHNATNETVINMTKNNTLNKKYVIYFIKLNMDAPGLDTSAYQTNRHMGEMLANEYIVHDLAQYHPFVVVDVHEMEYYWDPVKYIQVISTNSPTAVQYGHKMSQDTGIEEYNFTEGTSPQWVTEPIADQGFNTILFETAQSDSQENKTKIAESLIKSIDSFTPA
ncbi:MULTISPECIES: hypothetical protein [Methanobrevibacter]|uniref:hypothetical protein n=1 Tax=Methanobrevibacter TaxID=2172 RepID=UPI00033485A3|nr:MULTISPECIES: hypothetical protein [Methanobrevibacter]AGN16774.1 hypothetical protein Abm4_0887 [Methanobrevibacter sp. AbM4]MCI6774982.1 hypothetical protein [Methanobrevibacter boviskoreani]MDY5614199.1 hypothetical protein [Methanobrevibacter boviskoreani]